VRLCLLLPLNCMIFGFVRLMIMYEEMYIRFREKLGTRLSPCDFLFGKTGNCPAQVCRCALEPFLRRPRNGAALLASSIELYDLWIREVDDNV
jgi:hypothetical protein